MEILPPLSKWGNAVTYLPPSCNPVIYVPILYDAYLPRLLCLYETVRSVQEVNLDKHIKLLDSPGVIMATKSSDSASLVLRNCVKVDVVWGRGSSCDLLSGCGVGGVYS